MRTRKELADRTRYWFIFSLVRAGGAATDALAGLAGVATAVGREVMVDVDADAASVAAAFEAAAIMGDLAGVTGGSMKLRWMLLGKLR